MPCLTDVSLLRGINLTSSTTIWTVGVLVVVFAVVAAVLLPLTLPTAARRSPARTGGATDAPDPSDKATSHGSGGRTIGPVLGHGLKAAGRYSARAVLFTVPVLLVVALGGLLINRPMHYVRTFGDVIEAAAPHTQGASRVTPLPDASAYDAVPAEAWKASFQDAGNGSQEATWTGPVSGITLPVRVVLPSGYRPDDGRTYNVIEAIHGWVGDPQSVVTGMSSSKNLQAAIDAGRIPPSILVIPSVNVDGSQHDCVNIAGRPPVETWTAEEIPRMIQASFPNVTTQRAGWMLMGISAGAYCAARTAYDVPQRFGSVGVLSSFDSPGEGVLAHGGKQLQSENTMSTMLGRRTPDGMRFYVMGAQDDSTGSARAAWFMQDAVQRPDSVTIDTPRQGGHSWVLWNDRLPSLLTWWGSDPAVFAAAGLPAPDGDAWAGAKAAGIKPPTQTPKDQRTAGSPSPMRADVFELNGLGTIIVSTVASLAAAGTVLVWAPRWGRRRDGAKPSTARLGGAIVGRFAAVVVAASLIAVTAGIGVNASGGFYTSWRDLRASVRVNDNAGK